jgi:5'-deoxynucleotidase YfbR-like HD superfamily hydrolase
MYHDLPEIVQGDIPTPLKIGDVRKENAQLEKEAISIFKDKWKLWLGSVEEYDYSKLDDVESRIVKCADLLSCLVYCTEEIYLGSRNLEQALMRTLKKLVSFAHHDWERKLVKEAFHYVKEQLQWDVEKVLI